MHSSRSLMPFDLRNNYIRQLIVLVLVIAASSFARCFATAPAPITVYASSEPGSDVGTKLNECIAAVIAGGGGTCDATGLGGAGYINAAQVNVGDTAGHPVTLLVPSNANWGINSVPGGGSCGFMVYNNSALIAYDVGTAQTASISAEAGLSATGIVCTDSSGGANSNSFRIEGINFDNLNGGTLSEAVAVLRGCKDNSIFRNNYVVNPYGVGVHIGGTNANAGCTVLSVEDTWVNGSSGQTGNTTAQPVVIQGSSVAGTTSSIRWFGGSIVQPGAGKNNVLIDGGGANYVQDVSFYGVHIEGTIVSSDGGTPMVRISYAGPVNWIGGVAYQSIQNGAYCFRVENSTNTASSFQAVGVECGSSVGRMIQNTGTGFNFVNPASANINFYTDGKNYSFGH
jgi:hypothetical protein